MCGCLSASVFIMLYYFFVFYILLPTDCFICVREFLSLGTHIYYPQSAKLPFMSWRNLRENRITIYRMNTTVAWWDKTEQYQLIYKYIVNWTCYAFTMRQFNLHGQYQYHAVKYKSSLICFILEYMPCVGK